MPITGKQIADFAISCLGHPYMYGVNGLRITEALIQQKRRQYPTKFSDKKIAYLRTKIGQIAYQCNSFLTLPLGVEKTANGWLANAAQCGSISTIPEMLGVSVHYNGHVGIYIGNGYVVEARGTYYGVVKTRVDERPWKEWAMQPNVAYNTMESEDDFMIVCKRGDIDSAGAMPYVKAIQKGLLALGYVMKNNSGSVFGADGIFGEGTQNAVRQFKKDVGITTPSDEVTSNDVVTMILALSESDGDYKKGFADAKDQALKAISNL